MPFVCSSLVGPLFECCGGILLTDSLDGSERQIIKDMDGNVPRAKIKACSICDLFVLILREDETIGLFIGETERGKIRRKDMSPMGDKVTKISSTLVRFTDAFFVGVSLFGWMFLQRRFQSI
jgi:hypothetical protein